MVADINAKKGAWSFLEMAATLVKNHPEKPLKFVMVGRISENGNTLLNDGSIAQQSPKKYIETFVAKHNLQDKLVLTGFRKDALAVMAGFDVLIVANSNGVMGRQPIEAQALGVPTVVTQGHSGKSTILLNNQSGFVISNPVKQDELLKSVEELINNPEKRAEFRRNGQQYAAEKFNPVINMGKIETIYQALLPKN
jgi:glycosyltransferase involved in cell wall biosynthesis